MLTAAPDAVEIRRNGGLAALVGVTASAVGIAYLGRATQTGVLLDWVLFGVMALVILPLLPEGPYGPLGGIRPREIWALPKPCTLA